MSSSSASISARSSRCEPRWGRRCAVRFSGGRRVRWRLCRCRCWCVGAASASPLERAPSRARPRARLSPACDARRSVFPSKPVAVATLFFLTSIWSNRKKMKKLRRVYRSFWRLRSPMKTHSNPLRRAPAVTWSSKGKDAKDILMCWGLLMFFLCSSARLRPGRSASAWRQRTSKWYWLVCVCILSSPPPPPPFIHTFIHPSIYPSNHAASVIIYFFYHFHPACQTLIHVSLHLSSPHMLPFSSHMFNLSSQGEESCNSLHSLISTVG